MAKKENEDSLMAAVLSGFKAAGIKDPEKSVTTLDEYWRNMKWIDLFDPITGRPCIALEWEIGARGIPQGKVVQVRGSFSDAKSTLLYLVYGCAMRGSTTNDRKAWVAHIETEGAPNAAEYVAKYGCDPRLLLYMKTNDLNDMFKKVDIFDMSLHGGRSGTVNQETGRTIKSKFPKEEALDPEMEKPAIVGIDSLSNVGTDAGDDFVDLDKSERPGGDSKDVRRIFRAREQIYDEHNLTMLVTTHETTEIKTGIGAGHGAPKSTARNQKAVGMALTLALDTKDYPWKDSEKNVLGSRQFLHTFKNKLAPRYRDITLFRNDLGGYDMAETDLQFFVNADGKNNNCKNNPFSPGGFLCPEGAKHGITRVRGGWSAPMVSEKVFKTAEEFVDALYSDKDLLKRIREHLRIKGFGFDFETRYTVADDQEEGIAESVDESEEEAPEENGGGDEV